jgi:hypothetical protein
MPLRSRQFFPELHALEGSNRRLESSADEEALAYDLYESPCILEVSNDEFSPKTIDTFDVCDLDFYGGCMEDAGDLVNTYSGDELFELKVYFDYELYYRNGANPVITRQHLEGTMLEHLASVLTLNTCDSGTDRRQQRQAQQSRANLHDFSDKVLAQLLGISREPSDLKDADFGKREAVMEISEFLLRAST